MLERVDLASGGLMNLAIGGAIAAACGLAMSVPFAIPLINDADPLQTVLRAILFHGMLSYATTRCARKEI